MIKLKPKKLALAVILSVQSTSFLSSSILPSEGSRLAEEHYAILTQAHNRVYKRDFVDWSKEIWGDPVPAKKGETLHEGMQVGTANKSWAEISWPSVTTRAWENSVVAISPGKRLVYLLNGEMLFQLDKNRKDKSETVIWTRVLQLRLHGTSVLVQAMNDFTRVAVLEGEIDVTNRYDNSVISLKPGAVYEVRTGTAPAGPPAANTNRSPNSFGSNNSGNSFGAGQGNSPGRSGSAASNSNQNYANQLNSSDWQAFKEMKERMPGIPDPQNWGPSDYQKFQDMKSKWSFMKQQEEEKKQKEEEYKKQYWQNKENQIPPQDWQKLQRMREMKEQWERNKYNKGQAPRPSGELAISTMDGEPDIYPTISYSNDKFDNLVNDADAGSYTNIRYDQDCPQQQQWQQKKQSNCNQNSNPQCNTPQQWQQKDCSQQQQWQKDCTQQQNCKPGPQDFRAGANTNWNPNSSPIQKSPSLFSASPIASRWDTQELAPTGAKNSNSVKNTDSSFVREIVSWNAPPINVFRTEKSATNIYLADTDAILKHPLLGSSFAGKIASADLIQSALGRFSSASRGTAGDPTQVRNVVFDEAVAVVQAPTVPSFLTGREIGPGNAMPGSRKTLNSALNK